jgi:predicted DNA-binding protein (MmcQ/YjbR family)
MTLVPVPEKLLAAGFAKRRSGWTRTVPLAAGFAHVVEVPARGGIRSRVVDAATGDEYVAHRVHGATGAFVGAVRAAEDSALAELRATCFSPEPFDFPQTRAASAFCVRTWGEPIEFLWDDAPDCGIHRRADNRKWYAVLMAVRRDRLGLPGEGRGEAINLRMDPAAPVAFDGRSILPGWHMNKRSWFSLVLDGSLPLRRIQSLIRRSRDLALRR